MSIEVTMNDAIAAPDDGQLDTKEHPQPAFLHSPPDSNKVHKSDASDSELSDLDEEPILSDAPEPAPASDPPEPPQEDEQHEAKEAPEQDDIGEILPDHWSGTVPVFKPTMHQFKDFKRFMEAVDSYGMKSGIIKIIPPEEWKDSLPAIDDLIKQVKVREPIKQDIMGSNGTYRQMNILHGRSYNLPQWRQLCDQSEHQPPARRGERRANVEKTRATRSRATAPKPANTETPKKRGRGRAPKGRGRGRPKKKQEDEEEEDRPMTPVSPKVEADNVEDKPVDSIEKDPGVEVDPDDSVPTVGRMGGARQAKPQMQSVSARRKYSRREGSAMIDEAAFKDWDYKMDISEYTPERCEELERVYWKTLTYAPPLYGADLMGTLFHESTELWNLNKLPNLLDVLGTKVPGVNTAYLYLGMWKATFAWHLEDVDLYSINYLHFGAPKQWYSISQKDARRFEAAMKSIWPTDAKACDQFLRHKAFLISPQHLLNHFNIKVNKCLSYPGEFVVTYPYGYHSGYNLGYNCAEAVNFALDSWLDMGKIAKKCDCAQAQDSVWVNVYEIERRLRGEETEEEETEDEEEESDDEASGLPTPPASHGVKFKDTGRKRKRGPGGKAGKDSAKKIKLRIKTKAEPPCCLCPHDVPSLEILPTDDGRKAHRMCALYLPETFVETVDSKEVVCNVARIHKDRLDLKCLYCRSKRGACFQCSQKRCARAYHATCAAAAGVFVEEEEVPVFGEDGTEYKEQAFEFSCRFHRTKRDRKVDGEALENDSRITAAAAALKKGDICQLQYHKGEIFGGLVVENRRDEQTFLLDILPTGDRLEVEWKWLLLADPSDYHLPKASANAIPMPTTREAKDNLKAKRGEDDKPRKDDPFVGSYTWAEFQLHEVSNKNQVKVDFSKPDQIWHYLGRTSTEARAQYTEDPSNPRHNPRGNYLDTIPKSPKPAPAAKAARYSSYGTTGNYGQQYNTSTMRAAPVATTSTRPEKPYVYKPRKPVYANFSSSLGTFTSQRFTPMSSVSPTPRPQVPSYPQYNHTGHQGYQNQNTYSAQRFEVKGPQHYMPPQSVPQSHYPTNVPTRPVQHQWMQPMSVSQPPVASHSTQRPAAPVPDHQPAPAPVQATVPAASPAQNRPHARPTWQVHSSIYQKYEFFQVNHNRDSTKYRTPYSPYGGFTNGYEGNLRAHLMANKDELLRRSSIMSSSPPQQPAYPVPAYHSTYNMASTGAPPAHTTSQVPSYNYHHQQPAPAPRQPAAATTKSHPHLPPAIKSQYLPAQLLRSPAQKTPTESKPKPAPVPKSYKLPPKESPVPLPAGFLAAMASTTATPASAAKAALKATTKKSPINTQHLPVAATSTQGSPPAALQTASTITQRNTKPATSTPSATPTAQPTVVKPASNHSSISPTPAILTAPANQAPQPVASPATSGSPTKISVTPVPIPKLPGMVQQTRPAESPVPLPQPLTLAQVAAPATQTPNRPALRIQTSQGPVSSAVPIKSEIGLSTNTEPQEFSDVPGGESMEFIERLIGNLRKVSQQYNAN